MRRTGRIILVKILLAISVCGCRVQIYDLQPIIPTVPTPTRYIQPTQFVSNAATPNPSDNETELLHIAPTAIREKTAVDILELVMINGGIGWSVGRIPGQKDKMILRTEDGGNNWKNITPSKAIYENTGRDLEVSTFFFNETTAWILFWEPSGWSPTLGVPIWRTFDGGITWNFANLPITNYTIKYFRNAQIMFINQNEGRIFAKLGQSGELDYIGLYATHDGGATWSTIVTSDSANLPPQGMKNGAVFKSTLEGWISGGNSRDEPSRFLWHTYDGGNAWESQTLPPPSDPAVPANLFTDMSIACSLSVPKFVDFQFQYAYATLNCAGGSLTEDLSILYWTYDTGRSWKTAKLPKPHGNLSFFGIYEGWYTQPTDPGSPFAYEILHTQDGGTTWNVISQTAWDSVLQFITPVIGFGVVDYLGRPAMVKSENGGFAWSQIFPMVIP